MKAGLIGLGNMGSALAAGLLNGGALPPERLFVFNRSPQKSESFRARFPGVHVASGERELTDSCDIIFVCTGSKEIPAVLSAISPSCPGKHIVVVNGGLDLDIIEGTCRTAASKLIPSVTMEVGRGVSLLCHGKTVTAEQRETLQDMLGKASVVKVLPEGQLGAATDLTSCGPALISEMMHQLSMAGVHHGGLDQVSAWDMVLETLVGTALTLEKGVSVREIEGMVATKGGITEQGLKVLEKELPAVLDHMMEATKAKQASVRESMTSHLDR